MADENPLAVFDRMFALCDEINVISQRMERRSRLKFRIGIAVGLFLAVVVAVVARLL